MAFGPWGVKADEQAGKQKKHIAVYWIGENPGKSTIRRKIARHSGKENV